MPHSFGPGHMAVPNDLLELPMNGIEELAKWRSGSRGRMSLIPTGKGRPSFVRHRAPPRLAAVRGRFLVYTGYMLRLGRTPKSQRLIKYMNKASAAPADLGVRRYVRRDSGVACGEQREMIEKVRQARRQRCYGHEAQADNGGTIGTGIRRRIQAAIAVERPPLVRPSFVFADPASLVASCSRLPIHRITGTDILLPMAL